MSLYLTETKETLLSHHKKLSKNVLISNPLHDKLNFSRIQTVVGALKMRYSASLFFPPGGGLRGQSGCDLRVSAGDGGAGLRLLLGPEFRRPAADGVPGSE